MQNFWFGGDHEAIKVIAPHEDFFVRETVAGAPGRMDVNDRFKSGQARPVISLIGFPSLNGGLTPADCFAILTVGCHGFYRIGLDGR